MQHKRPFPIIDADIHPVFDGKRIAEFLPPLWRKRWEGGNRGAGYPGYWNPGGVHRADAQTEDGRRIENAPDTLSKLYLDAEAIEFGILNENQGLTAGLHPDLDYGSAMISAINDVLVNDWLPKDPRFRGSLAVSPNDPVHAVKEIHRLGSHPGIAQVIMSTASLHPYGHRMYHPIFEAAQEHNLPVAVHPGAEGSSLTGAPTAAGFPSNYLEWHTSLTGNAQAHAVSLVTSGVFAKYPKLRFVMIECGVLWAIPLMWRLNKNWKGLRQLTPWIDRLPSEIFAEHIRLTTQPIEEPDERSHFHEMLAMLPFEKCLMYSSDYPHWDGDTPDFVARSLPESMRFRVMSENARELYRLPASVHSPKKEAVHV